MRSTPRRTCPLRRQTGVVLQRKTLPALGRAAARRHAAAGSADRRRRRARARCAVAACRSGAGCSVDARLRAAVPRAARCSPTLLGALGVVGATPSRAGAGRARCPSTARPRRASWPSRSRSCSPGCCGACSCAASAGACAGPRRRGPGGAARAAAGGVLVWAGQSVRGAAAGARAAPVAAARRLRSCARGGSRRSRWWRSHCCRSRC